MSVGFRYVRVYDAGSSTEAGTSGEGAGLWRTLGPSPGSRQRVGLYS